MNVAKFRVARPTSNLAALRAFYIDGLGLVDKGTFHDHDGYDGHLYATADERCEIEFTTHAADPVKPPPSPNNLLVFYLPDRAAVDAIAARLATRGIAPVEPANPYWLGRGLTFEDPDGWRLVLFDTTTLKRA